MTDIKDYEEIIKAIPDEIDSTDDDIKNMIDSFNPGKEDNTNNAPIKNSNAINKTNRLIERYRKAGYDSATIIKAIMSKTDLFKKKETITKKELTRKKNKLAKKSRLKNRK